MISSMLVKNCRYFSKYAQALSKIPTVAETVIWFNCQDKEGNWHRINGFEGSSLLEAISKHCIPITASCEGGESGFSMVEKPIEPYAEIPACRECHVELDIGWYNQLERHPYEEIALNSQDAFTRGPTSRLACCIRIEPWMREMRFKLGHVQDADQDQGTQKPWYRK